MPFKEEDGKLGTRWEGKPAFVKASVLDEVEEKFKKAKEDAGFAGRSDYWFLQSMAVHPDHQGRGVAYKLMQYTLQELIDRDAAEAYLEASPPGKNLYLKCGFEEKGVARQLDGEYVITIMSRPAQSKNSGREAVNGGV